MKRWYSVTTLIFALGLGLVVYATANTEAMILYGVTIQAHVIKGLGLITMILGVLALLAMYGNSLSPNRSERRKQEMADAKDLSTNDTRPHRRMLTARLISRRSASTARPVRRVVPKKENANAVHE